MVRTLTSISLLLLGLQVQAQSPSVPTWSGQVAPILYRNCTTCHHPGGAGHFSLTTYDDARTHGSQIVENTQSRVMPPWLPEPHYGNLAGSRRLPDVDRATLKRWLDASMPVGDLAKAPAAPVYSSTWTLGTPDLILTIPEPFPVPPTGEDVFQNFILPYTGAQTRYIRAMEILPGAADVHHANVLIDRTAQYRHEHAADWKHGVPGMELVVDSGKSFEPDGHFLFWKPDSPAIVERPTMPWRLDPGNDLILNMHLQPSGKPATVNAQIGLYFTDQPPTELPMLLQLDRDDGLDIRAGQTLALDDTLTLPIDVDLLGIYPHAHYLGKELKAWATLPTGRTEPLIWIRDWDIDRQSVYEYERPVRLPRGTVLHMHYLYDNTAANPRNPSTPPVPVHAGNRSQDEMAHLWLQVLPVQPQKAGEPDPRLLLEEAWMRARLRKVPNDYVSLYNLGAALTAQGKSRESVTLFQQMVQQRPDDDRSWNALGAAMNTSGDWQQAQITFTHAIEHDAANCDARFNLAQLDLKHDLPIDAETRFRALLAHCPEDSDAHDGLGQSLLAQQQFQAAQPEFERALALQPPVGTTVAIKQHLAFALVQLGDTQAALTQLREASQLSPNDADSHTLLAQVLAQDGRLNEAIAEQQIALKLRSNDADGWNNLGVFQARNGQRDAARKDFEQALKVDPASEQARQNLSRLGDPPQ